MAQIFQKSCQKLSWALSTKREVAQDSDLADFLGDLSKSEKLSEIKSPVLTQLYPLKIVKLTERSNEKRIFMNSLTNQIILTKKQ